MTLLSNLVEVSRRVGAESARLGKVREIAQFLRTLGPPEVGVGVLYLAGEVPQGRCGIGPTSLREAHATAPASTPGLSLSDVDALLTSIAALCGKGVAARRAGALRDLFARATAAERHFRPARAARPRSPGAASS